MDASLQKYPISDGLQAWILQELWRECGPDPGAPSRDMPPYSDYYSTQCQRFSRDGGIYLCTKTHHALVNLVKKITQDKTRDALCLSLGSQPSAGASTPTDTTINLCASLLLMADVGVHKFGFSGSNSLAWSGQHTLRQALERHFRPDKALQPDNPRFGALFTARNLTHIGGMTIEWTSNIIDHLLLSDDDQTVFIFHHASFLRYQQTFTTPLFPDTFVDETLRTLSLLFPQNDRRSRRWLRSQIAQHDLDPSLARCGNLRAQNRRFEHFRFWHDRLVILKQAFDESSPRGLRQWWNDRRNSVQWYTFWVAILVFVMTLFFGLVQSVEGALQVYLSWKALGKEGP